MPYPLILLLVLIVVGSIAPSTSLESLSEMAGELRAGATLALHPPALITLLERLITFLPAGILVHRELVRRRVDRAPLRAAGAIAAFAVAIELIQLPVAGRHTRLSDLVVAVAWGAGGVLISAWLGEPPARSKVRLVVVTLLLLGNVTVTSVILRGHRDAELAGWDCSYPLLIGNELTGDRPWLGRIRGLAIYPRALSADEVAGLENLPFGGPGAAARGRLGSLAVFDFARVAEDRVPQLLPDRPALELSLPPAGSGAWQIRDRALELREPLLIRSTAAPRELCDAVMSSRAVAIEAEIASAALDQSGPARIVSLSTGTLQRDFTLGQEQGALVFRVRTPWNGANGIYKALTAWDALADQDWHHVVAIYAGGAATVFRDGARIEEVRYDQLMWLGETDVVPLAGCAGVAFLALGLVMAALTAGVPWPARLAWVYLGAGLIPTGAGVVAGLQLGHDPDWRLIAAAVLGPGIGLLGWRSWSWLESGWRR